MADNLNSTLKALLFYLLLKPVEIYGLDRIMI
jgi:hypothetical protein